MLNGQASSSSLSSPQHQAVATLCKFRNEFVHVKFDRRIVVDLPPRDEALRLYNERLVAMEDINVLLGRHKTRDKKIVAGLTVHP